MWSLASGSAAAWHDAVVGVVWLILTWAIVRRAWWAAGRFFPADCTGGRVLHTAVLSTAAVVGLGTVVGAAGLLSGPSLLLAGWAAVLAVELLARRMPDRPQPTTTPAFDPWGWVWVPAAGLLATHAGSGLLRFPSDYDNLIYHLPLVNHWLQQGSLYAPAGANWFLAANTEVVTLWLAAPFSGDFLTGLSNVPSTVVWAAGAVELGRRLGGTGPGPHLTALGVVLVPTLGQQVCNASNDLAVAGFFVAGAAYAVRWRTGGRSADLALCGVCCGLLAGTKYFAVGYAIVLVAGLVSATAVAAGSASAARAGLTVALTAAPFGGYWYARNWLVTGAPLFPMGPAGPRPDLGYPELWRSTLAGSGHPLLLPHAWDCLWNRAGLFPAAALVAAPLIAGLYLTNRSMPGRVCVPVWLVGAAGVLLVTPFAVENQPGTLNQLRYTFTPVRYGLSLLTFAGVAAGAILLTPPVRPRRGMRAAYLGLTAGAAVVVVVQVRQLAESPVGTTLTLMVAGINLSLVAVALAASFRIRPRLVAVVAAAAVGVGGSVGILTLSEHWHGGLGRHFDKTLEGSYFEELHAAQPRRLCVLGDLPYPFFGSARQHTVFNPRLPPDPSETIEYMVANRIAEVAVEQAGDDKMDRYQGAESSLRRYREMFHESAPVSAWSVFRVEPTHSTGKPPDIPPKPGPHGRTKP